MFSGIVEETAEVRQLTISDQSARLVVCCSKEVVARASIGDSICLNGVCLTVVEKTDSSLHFDLASETLRKTAFQSTQVGSKINLERSLRLGDPLHGHLVFGHVDGIIKLVAKDQEGESLRLTFELPESLRSFLVKKGSVSLSGVSLTVGEVEQDRFSVYIIPHTAEVTTLGVLTVGEVVNIEVDMLARYVQRCLQVSKDSR